MSIFKPIVLGAQKELCAKIWTAKSCWFDFFEKMKILRGFSTFWSFLLCQLQIDRSRSSEGVVRVDSVWKDSFDPSFLFLGKSRVDFLYFGVFINLKPLLYNKEVMNAIILVFCNIIGSLFSLVFVRFHFNFSTQRLGELNRSIGTREVHFAFIIGYPVPAFEN